MKHFLSVFLLVVMSGVLPSSLSVADEIPRAADAPQPLAPADSAKRFRLPDGFRIELVACEPLIQEPSCIAFDEYGRMFVTELHGYNVEGELDVAELNKSGKLDREVRRLRWEFLGGDIAEQAKTLQYGKLKVLYDTDGDGQMDRAELWADDLPPAYGCIAAYGGVVVVAAPDILFLADRDGDGKVDVRRTLYTGFHKREMERGINNPRRGPDNWIYIGAGGHGGTIERPAAVPGLEPAADQQTPRATVDLSHSDFRINLATQAIEPVTGRVGTYGLAMNDVADRFPCSGGQPAIYALPLDYNTLARNPWVPTPSMNYSAANYGNGFRISQPHPWRVRRRQDPAWIKFYGDRETDSNYFTGGCGGEIYNADLFPEQYLGDFYYCEPSLNIVHRSKLTRDGAGYRARRAPENEQSEFLASTDQWFRPMNLRTGPDGALYIVDMYREIIEDYSAIPRFLQQQYRLDRGREHGRIWRLLPASAPKSQSFVLFDPQGQQPHRMTRDRFVALLESPNMYHRTTAQRVLLESDVQFDFDVDACLRDLLHASASPLAKLHALHLLEQRQPLRSEDLRMALTDADYRVRVHGVKLCKSTSISPDVATQLRSMVDDDDASVRLQLAAVLAGLENNADALLSLARTHGDERWMDAAILSSLTNAAPLLLRMLAEPELQDGPRQLLERLSASVAGTRDLQTISSVIGLLPECHPDVQQVCLNGLVSAMDRWPAEVDIVPTQSATAAMERLLLSDDRRVSDAAMLVAIRLLPAESLGPRFDQAIADALNETRSLEDRVRAIELLSKTSFQYLSRCEVLLDSRQAPVLQKAIIGALSGMRDTEAALMLLANWSGYTPEIRKLTLTALLSQEDFVPVLAKAIDAGTIRVGELDAGQRERLTRLANGLLSDRVRELLSDEQRASNLDVASRIADYASRLQTADRNATRGQVVFEKNCLNCHRVGEQGHDVGPALGSIVNKPDEAILVDVLDPGSKIDSEYASYTVVTSQGRSLTGVLGSESPTSVTLKMEKGQTETVLRNELELIKASDVSLMPSNLHEQITADQMADLLAYLRVAFAK